MIADNESDACRCASCIGAAESFMQDVLREIAKPQTYEQVALGLATAALSADIARTGRSTLDILYGAPPAE